MALPTLEEWQSRLDASLLTGPEQFAAWCAESGLDVGRCVAARKFWVENLVMRALANARPIPHALRDRAKAA